LDNVAVGLAKSLLRGFWLLLSPFGLHSAARRWSTTTAITVGVVLAGLQVSLFFSFFIVGIGEPYKDYEQLYTTALVGSLGVSACVLPFMLVTWLLALRFLPTFRDGYACRIMALAHVPLTIPILVWLCCWLAIDTREPSFSFMRGGKPDWIYSPIVDAAGSWSVGAGILVCAGVLSSPGYVRPRKVPPVIRG
jgi:hypothetical protein